LLLNTSLCGVLIFTPQRSIETIALFLTKIKDL
jgi:hypothetical protein